MVNKLFLIFVFCFTALSVLAQEKEREVPKVETKEESRPVEQPRNDPPPPPRNDPPPPPREEPRQSDNSSNNNSSNNRSSNNDSDSKSSRRDNDSDNRNDNRRSNSTNNNDSETPVRPKVINDNKSKVPVDKPNPPVTPPNQNNPTKDKDDEEEERKKRRRNDGGWGGLGGNYPYPQPNPPTRPFSIRDYFDNDDVFFNFYSSYVETDQTQFLPYFNANLGANYEPLYYIYGREFGLNEFPFVATDWTVYYEPDLGDIYVDFNRFGFVRYEKMVWFADGETYKKIAKKANYKGQVKRPVLVENLPQIANDRVYSFSVRDLPKGEYEMRFIARDGSTIKHFIRLK